MRKEYLIFEPKVPGYSWSIKVCVGDMIIAERVYFSLSRCLEDAAHWLANNKDGYVGVELRSGRVFDLRRSIRQNDLSNSIVNRTMMS